MIRLSRLLTQLALKKPTRVVVFWGLMVVLALSVVGRIPLSTSNLDLLEPDAPETVRFLEFGKKFGSPNALFLMIWDGSPEARHAEIDRILPVISELDGVRNVIGKMAFSDDVLDLLGLEPYMDSDDDGMSLLVIQPKDLKTEIKYTAELVGAIRELMSSSSQLSWGLTGIPVYALDDQSIIAKDISKLSLFGLVGVGLLVLFGFRSFKPPLLAVLSLLVAILSTAGVIFLFPGRLTLLSASFASLLLGLGIDGGIHVIHLVENGLRRGMDKKDAIARALQQATPGVWTGTCTSAMVFSSLWWTDFLGFRELGFIGALGLLLSYFAMITLFPAFIVWVPFSVKNRPIRPVGFQKLAGSFKIVWLLLLVPGLIIWKGLPQFDPDYLKLQPEDSTAAMLERKLFESFELSSQFAGFMAVDSNGAEELTQRLQVLPQVKRVLSIRDFELLQESGFDFDIPSNIKRLLVSETGERAVYAYPEGNIWDSDTQEGFFEAMTEIDPEVTGMPIIGYLMLQKTHRALWVSGGLSSLFVVALVWLDFRNLKWTILALLPVLLTSLALPGLMSLFNMSLNPINILAIPVVIGIAVDDGVHFIHQLRLQQVNLGAALSITGKSILITSLTNLAAFGCLLFTSHRGLQSFVALLCIGVSFALIVSLLLLPQVVLAFQTKLRSS